MRHLSIAVIFFLSVVGVANANPLDGKDLKFVGSSNFVHQFPQATNVSYTVKGQFTEVNFVWNDLKLQAFYDVEGNLLATCRPMTTANLPVAAQLTLKNQYPAGVARDAIEYNDPNDGVSYYVTMFTPKTTYLLHVSTSGTISVFKKMKN
ncbi:MAG TPA: hypothetical protein VGS79_20740 [Puia sp.]|nr:hypothetical protein [Puia sp.]